MAEQGKYTVIMTMARHQKHQGGTTFSGDSRRAACSGKSTERGETVEQRGQYNHAAKSGPPLETPTGDDWWGQHLLRAR